jgi:hypothetical protein
LTRLRQSETPATFEIEELGPVVMKGLPEAVRLFRVSPP